MSKIAVLLPREFMLEQAKRIIEENQLEIDILRVIKTADSVYEARKAVEEGAEIIVARGVQASFIKTYTKIPLVEIMLTAQELGRLIKKAKQILDKENPQIAIIGFRNMYSDTSYFNEIFDITLKTYFVESLEEAKDAVDTAMRDGAELIIGGDVVNELARSNKLPTLFIESTEDSIRNALNTARKMSYAAEVEKAHIAQFETVLDSSANGIIQMNEKKEITIVNHHLEEMLGRRSKDIEGKGLERIVPELDMELIDAILNGSRDTYTTSVHIGKTSVMATMTPIQYEARIKGAILSCYRLTTQVNKEAEWHREMYLHGYIARSRFTDISTSSTKMKQAVETAKMYALSKKPIVIYGEEGTEKEIFAQSIHNNSSYKSGPFVSVNCSGMSESRQLEMLFGNPRAEEEAMKKGALAIGDLGTVFLSETEKLTAAAQYRLYRAIQYEALLQNDLEKSQTLDNRIIVTASKDLGIFVKEGTFRADLFYLLNGLSLVIPPLRERTKDIEERVRKYKKAFTKRYSKYLTISAAAMETLKTYAWPGNEVQLEAFCERMFLTTQKKTIHEDYVQALLDTLYPQVLLTEKETRVVVYKHPKAIRIAELLEKHNGNRTAVAKEMNISTTTLWRYMKKYRVDPKILPG